jgi:hypothetical protein
MIDMKKLGVTLILFILCLSGIAQAQETQKPFRMVVEVESAFVRVLPSEEAEPVASVFEDNILEAVGRNLDGTWFEVRRPGRLSNLGWIFNEMVDWEFQPEYLPLTDITTGVVGPSPLGEDPGFAVFVLSEVTLRDQPSVKGRRILFVLHTTTVPVLERNQDASWLHINYLGYDGWISGFNTRQRADILDVTEAINLPPLETIPVIVIPKEVQLAQVQRLRDYITISRDLAANLESFWWDVYQGDIMPCSAPAFVTNYPYSQQDVRELPELKRYLPRLDEAIASLNSAIEPLTICGVFDNDAVMSARNSAINAKIIFNATLDRLTDLEKNVIR